MTSYAFQHDSGAFLSAVAGVAPQSASAAVNGSQIDRLGNLSAKLVGLVGSVSGAPTSFSVEFKIQHSSDGSTWTDLGSSVTISAANTLAEADLDLSSANQYVRVVATPSFTGGTTPAADVCAVLVLGGKDRLAGA